MLGPVRNGSKKSETYGNFLEHEGHMFYADGYHKPVSGENHCYWRCCVKNCYYRVITKKHRVVCTRGEHRHDYSFAVAKRAKLEIKSLARHSHNTANNIVEAVLDNVPDFVKSILPNKQSLLRYVRRIRQATLPRKASVKQGFNSILTFNHVTDARGHVKNGLGRWNFQRE